MNVLIHSYNTETVSQQRHETKEKCANMENPYTVSRGAFLAAAKSNLSSSHQLDLLNMFNSGDYTELNTCLNFSQKWKCCLFWWPCAVLCTISIYLCVCINFPMQHIVLSNWINWPQSVPFQPIVLWKDIVLCWSNWFQNRNRLVVVLLTITGLWLRQICIFRLYLQYINIKVTSHPQIRKYEDINEDVLHEWNWLDWKSPMTR